MQTLARAQAARGATVQVVCINHADRTGNDATWSWRATTSTVEEDDGPVRVTRVGRLANVARLDLAPALVRALLRVGGGGADIVHLHLPNPTMMVPLVSFPLAAPLVITHHSDIVRQRLLGRAIRPLEHRVFGRAARVLATTPVYAATSRLLRRFASKVDVLPLGIDLRPFQELSPAAAEHARALLAGREQPLWLTVGRLVYYKALHIALRALRHVRGTLLVIGVGPLEAELRQLAHALGIADRVLWLGEASDDLLAGAYHAAKALWFPSNAPSEAFGLVQVEAMAAGCPVINCRVEGSGAHWVAPDGVSALTIRPDDPLELARAAERLASDPELHGRLAAGGRRRALTFTDDAMATRSLEVYSEVLGGRR